MPGARGLRRGVQTQVLDRMVETRTAGVEPGQLVRQYGQRFLRSCPALALNYFLQAAWLLARTPSDLKAVRGQLLRELITQSHAFGYLLGSGGVEGGGTRPSLRYSDSIWDFGPYDWQCRLCSIMFPAGVSSLFRPNSVRQIGVTGSS